MSTNKDRHVVALGTSITLLKNLGRLGSSLSRILESGDHRRLLSVVLNPSGYSDWRSFSDDYQALNLLRKYPGLRTGINTGSVALEKFLKCESVCRDTNTRFRMGGGVTPWCWERLLKARSFIERVLGVFSWDAAIQYCNFGPGANVGVPRKSSHLCKKIGNLNPTVTGLCVPLLRAYEEYDPHVRDLGYIYKVVEGSDVTTVPKDARSDRVIAIEPLWNMFFQKGIGGMIRSRLKKIGLDLNHSQPLNQESARIGSITGRLATIDLSSASDTICHSLVEYLFPPDWYEAMMTVRSPVSFMPDGSRVVLRKFSSMGNGFTFEMESLIFLALTCAVVPNGRIGPDVLVFGDDIVLPVASAGDLERLLSECGFTVNREKSFSSGPFRESCGKHFFRGQDVTPLFLKKELHSTHDLLWLANSLKRRAYRSLGQEYGLDGRYKDAWDQVVSRIPRKYSRCVCPDGFGDDGLLVDFDEAVPSLATKHGSGLEGYSTEAVQHVTRERHHNDTPALVLKLWFTRRDLPLGEASQLCLTELRPLNKVFRRRRHYPLWTTLGPWVNGL